MSRLREALVVHGRGSEWLGERNYWFYCPGCDDAHRYIVNGEQGPSWEFNGDMERPTFSPSMLCRTDRNGKQHVCHLLLRDGQLEFLSDCTHGLAGKTVPLPDLPEWLR